jgi:hypothetical protein
MAKTKKTEKNTNVANAQSNIDEELIAFAQELNEWMKERGLALQPFIRPLVTKTGFKYGEAASVDLVRFNPEVNVD